MDKILSSQKSTGVLTILAIVVLFFAVNIFSAATFRHARIDLTEGKLFTLSQGTVNILKGIDEPISIKLYYSERVATDLPEVRTTAERLKDLLAEFVDTADGNLRVEIIPVERYTASEDEASAAGLTGAQTRDGEIVYFGFVATNMVDGREVIPFVPLDREEYLEYDLISTIYRLNRIDLPVLGLITSLPLDTGPGGLQAAMQGRSQPYVIYEQLLGSFEVEHVDTDAALIPEGVEVLLIAHPDPLSAPMLYAIDQFVMGGGRVLALLDPFSEMSQTGQPQMMQSRQPVPTNDSSVMALGPLLTSWGVEIDPAFVVADRALGFYVPQSDYPPVLLWPRAGETEIDRDDIVSGELTLLQFASAGAINAIEGATTTLMPLVHSSTDSSLVEFQDAKFRKPFEDILADFVPDEASHILAARIQGAVSSAFPGGAPRSEGEAEDESQPAPAAPHITGSDAANIILVADADFLDDRFWVQIQNFMGERLMQPTADNGGFVVSAVENLMGSNDLISLRARAGSQRPFTLVQKIQREAEEAWLPKQRELETRLDEIAARVDELRGSGLPGETGIKAPQGAIVVTAEQRAELKSLLAEHEETRRAQREIQFNLRRDIDRLGNLVRFSNIAVVPLLVAFLAFGLSTIQTRRRRKSTSAIASGGQT
jgi:ABC-type uncharacterized transport system involved in gliding motility auxiliary subunit